MSGGRGFLDILAIVGDRLLIDQRIPGGWQARYSFQPDGTDLRLVALEVTPGPDARWLSASSLRSLSPAGAEREAHRLAQANPVTLRLMDDLQQGQRWVRMARRPRARGRGDLQLAALSSEYVKLVQARHRSPAAAVATSLGVRPAQVRDYLRRARERGLLSRAVHGVAGGKLTTKAEALLASADQEENE